MYYTFITRVAFLCACLFALTACGGGGDNAAVRSSSIMAERVASFNDGGVAQVTQVEDGLTGKMMIVRAVSGLTINDFVNDLNDPDAGDNVLLDPNSLSNLRAHPTATSTTGNIIRDQIPFTVTVNGITTRLNLDFVAYDHNSGNFGVFYAEESRETNLGFLYNGGETVSNIPSGAYTYSGFNMIADKRRTLDNVEFGTFTMNVNFSNAMVTNLNATTQSSNVTGGNIPINMQQGTFTGGIMLDLGGSPLSGHVYGDFHGDGATGVSGMYHDGTSNVRYVGGFAGSRQ